MRSRAGLEIRNTEEGRPLWVPLQTCPGKTVVGSQGDLCREVCVVLGCGGAGVGAGWWVQRRGAVF